MATHEGAFLRISHERRAASMFVDDPKLDLALWGSRFAGVATDAGTVLQRLARSVSIRERLDFSCGVFDGEGSLIANAPHVPVHLGAMGESVRDVLRHVAAPQHGDAWLSNDPAAGGSHLPDLTVVTCVIVGGERFFVASRAHHADVGGLTPGSMPPHSRTLGEEGIVFRRWALLVSGILQLPDLAASRLPDTVRADLQAQIAANRYAADALAALGEGKDLRAWMSRLVEVVATATANLVRHPPGGAHDVIDGIPLHLSVEGRKFDFSGTGGPHSGNLNAPMGVVRAALLYSIRAGAAQGLPLNEGVFREVELVLPRESVLCPPPDAAVVGGNVETSQRLVDLLLVATRTRAASAGTMNNLTIGGEGWVFYETIGGGLGAKDGLAGRSGRQLHMTNTRATDVEIVENSLPLRVRQFGYRRGSGGPGRWAGGEGLIREIELLQPGEASLLAAWRPEGAPGLLGGGWGAAGRAEVFRLGQWAPWAGDTIRLQSGDRVRIYTPGGGGWGAAAASAD